MSVQPEAASVSRVKPALTVRPLTSFMASASRVMAYYVPVRTARDSLPSLAVVLLFSFLAFAPPAASQPTQLIPLNGQTADESKKEGPDPAKESQSPAELRSSVIQQLKEAQALRARIEAADPLESAPPGITPEEEEERRTLVRMLITSLSVRLNFAEALQEARDERQIAEQEARTSTGPEGKPPYSILKLDELRGRADDVRVRVQGLESALEIVKNDLPRLRIGVKKAEEDSRRVLEAQASARTPEDTVLAAWRKKLADLRVRFAALGYANSNLRADVLTEELMTARAQLTPLELQVDRVSKDVQFSERDLKSVLSNLEHERENLEQELKIILDRNSQDLALRSRIQAELERARVGKNPEGRGVRLLETRLRVAEAAVENSKVASDVLPTLITINQGFQVLWQQRFDAFAGADPEIRRSAYDKLGKALERIRPWVPYTQRLLNTYRSRENSQEIHVAALPPSDPERRFKLVILDSYQKRRLMYERLASKVAETEKDLLHWQKDFEASRASRSFSQRLADGYAHLAFYARRAWNFELFAVEDTIEVAGQKVTTSRGVTVGKSVGAVILFLVGYLFVSFAGRRMHRVLVSRFGLDEQTANVLRRWTVALAVFTLLIVTLNLARIPLTVFAFLGGALAIGVGFGTQTLIKNFISGILLLLERKVRVGDIVEVEGVVGRVTEVDIRSSTVLGFDGIETLIPNASFLENKVTNWTHSSPQMRRVLRVGVAYGSPAQTVSEVLMECADRHGLILKTPEPVVLFEDFGENSMVFALYFWIEMLPHVNALKVASDLRFMIEKRFTEKGIIISFPQRDVHLDTEHPLKIQVVNDDSGVPER